MTEKQQADKEWEQIAASIRVGFHRLKSLHANCRSQRNRQRCEAMKSAILKGFEQALDIE